ncbi:MAG: hypothetical protein KA712_00505 [Myxococcales bacterium]|nr:hypothetical protein [Myxococcales bacterium]
MRDIVELNTAIAALLSTDCTIVMLDHSGVVVESFPKGVLFQELGCEGARMIWEPNLELMLLASKPQDGSFIAVRSMTGQGLKGAYFEVADLGQAGITLLGLSSLGPVLGGFYPSTKNKDEDAFLVTLNLSSGDLTGSIYRAVRAGNDYPLALADDNGSVDIVGVASSEGGLGAETYFSAVLSKFGIEKLSESVGPGDSFGYTFASAQLPRVKIAPERTRYLMTSILPTGAVPSETIFGVFSFGLEGQPRSAFGEKGVVRLPDPSIAWTDFVLDDGDLVFVGYRETGQQPGIYMTVLDRNTGNVRSPFITTGAVAIPGTKGLIPKFVIPAKDRRFLIAGDHAVTSEFPFVLKVWLDRTP